MRSGYNEAADLSCRGKVMGKSGLRMGFHERPRTAKMQGHNSKFPLRGDDLIVCFPLRFLIAFLYKRAPLNEVLCSHTDVVVREYARMLFACL